MSAQESWMPVKGPELAAKCPRCKTEPLFAMLVDDGKGVDGEKCFACGACWTHQFPLEVATLEGKLAVPVAPPVEAPAGCDDGHPGCSVCDAASAAEEAPRVTDTALAEVLELVPESVAANAWYADHGALMAREIVALRAAAQSADSHLQLWERQAGPGHPLAGAVADARRMLGGAK